MGRKAWALRIYSGTAPAETYREFGIEGEPRYTRTIVSNDDSNPPRQKEARDVLEFRRAELLSTAAQSALREFAAFLAKTSPNHADYPKRCEIVEYPTGGGAAVAVVTLPTAEHEQFRIEIVEWDGLSRSPAATGRTMVPITFRASAVIRRSVAINDANGVAVNGVVGWEQEIRDEYDTAGLRILEWTTTITTKEGTNAETIARSLGAIESSLVGPAYVYDTNGVDGLSAFVKDANIRTGRVPTVCTVVSRVRQLAENVGVSAPGKSPGELVYRITERSPGDGSEGETVTEASARGPNAKAWVLTKRPVVYSSQVIVDEPLTRFYGGTWVRRATEAVFPGNDDWDVSVTIRGGQRSVKFRKVCGGRRPLKSVGAYGWWVATVVITKQKRGGSATILEAMKLPALLPAPWILDPDQSEEGEPHPIERGSERSTWLWERTARLVYLSAEPPQLPVFTQLLAQAAAGPTSYLGSGQVADGGGSGLKSGLDGFGIVGSGGAAWKVDAGGLGLFAIGGG